jgi:predicted DsbA family dithiol-disulfide isomerase
LNEKDFNECVASGKYVEAIQQETKDGNQAGVSGTPGFFVNGVFLNGAVPASTFERVIEREIAAQKRRAEAAK